MKKQCETKECTFCHKILPKTSEYFSMAFRKNRGKTYPSSRCRKCLQKLGREYTRKNVERYRENHKRYDASPVGIYKKLMHSERNHPVTISKENFIAWFNSQPKKCYYCGLEEKNLKVFKDAYNNRTKRLTIDRMDSSKGYDEGNLVMCCLRCNHIKGDFFSVSEMVKIGKTFIKLKWKQNAKQH